METRKNIQKTQVFNVIILDRSGSMECIRQAAVDGFNETLAGIRKAQEKFADTQEHYVSLVTFCSCETKQVFDKVPVANAHPLTTSDYTPCCCTPLYDAMGYGLYAYCHAQTCKRDRRYGSGGYHHYGWNGKCLTRI